MKEGRGNGIASKVKERTEDALTYLPPCSRVPSGASVINSPGAETEFTVQEEIGKEVHDNESCLLLLQSFFTVQEGTSD